MAFARGNELSLGTYIQPTGHGLYGTMTYSPNANLGAYLDGRYGVLRGQRDYSASAGLSFRW